MGKTKDLIAKKAVQTLFATFSQMGHIFFNQMPWATNRGYMIKNCLCILIVVTLEHPGTQGSQIQINI